MARSRFPRFHRFLAQRPVASACLGASLAAFIAAGVGVVLNTLLAERMAVLGMCIVGFFYLGLGLWQLACGTEEPRPEPPRDDKPPPLDEPPRGHDGVALKAPRRAVRQPSLN